MVNVTMDSVCALFTAMILLYLRMCPDRKDKLNRLFTWICIFNIGMLLGDIPSWCCEGFAKPWYPAALKTGSAVLYISGCLLPWIYSYYIFTYLSAKAKMRKWVLPTIHTMFIMSATLLLLNFCNGMYYYIDSSNFYRRGELYWLSQVIPITMLLFDAAVILYHHHALRLRDIAAFLSYLMLPVIGIALQMHIYGITTTYLASSVSIFIIFLCIQSEQRLVSEQQKRSLDRAHMLIMLSQIQPHFLYNSLLGIKQLCDTEPPKASKALEYFSNYLRENLYSISNPGLISFQRELTHVRNYLYLEKMRFEDRLTIREEITVTDFSLPPLSLQPVVENAVRHGITKKNTGGTLIIKSESTNDSIVITVADDGIGFDMTNPPDSSRQHFGIENVKNRLETQCAGSLDIDSRPGEGTRVKITLPRKSTCTGDIR